MMLVDLLERRGWQPRRAPTQQQLWHKEEEEKRQNEVDDEAVDQREKRWRKADGEGGAEGV